MPLPRLPDIEVALLKALVALGGQAPANQVYPAVTKQFPQLTPEQLAELLPSGGNRWTNRIQWVRLRLVKKGEMASPAHGVWAITERGNARIRAKGGKEVVEPPPPDISLVDLYDDYEASFRDKLLDRLMQMGPREFELFARKLLRAYGFVEVEVTRTSGDGGIDGYGKLRLGLASMSVAFQCKRWKENVGRREVDEFRGAIQGEYEQGVFFATSDFSPQAREASLKRVQSPLSSLTARTSLT